MDFIAASFVRKASDVTNLRQLLAENGGQDIKIICKIENQEGLQNYSEILQVTDGIMVARGDLGMEIPPVRLSLNICAESSQILLTLIRLKVESVLGAENDDS